MKVKEESEKVGLKLNIKKTKIVASSPITSWQMEGGKIGRKGRGTRDQIANICWIMKQESSRKTSISALLTMPKPLTVWITINWKILKEMGIPDHLICLLWKQCQTLFFWTPKSLQMVTAAVKLKDAYSLEGKLRPT